MFANHKKLSDSNEKKNENNQVSCKNRKSGFCTIFILLTSLDIIFELNSVKDTFYLVHKNHIEHCGNND